MTTTGPREILAPSTLAQAIAGSGASTASAVSIVIWVGVLITALVLGGFAVMVLRRNLLAKDGPGAAGGLSLDQLRGMHRRGELTQEEYETARAALTSGLTGRPPPPVRRPTAASGRPPADGAMVAPPGFDLTGQPLPTGAAGSPRPGTGGKKAPPRSGGGTSG